MALDEFTRKTVEEKLGSFCENRVPPDARWEVKLSYRFWKNSVILYEEEVRGDNPEKWIKMKVARLDFDPESRGWTLWAYNSNERSMYYLNLPRDVSLDDAIAEIDEDPTGIFWG